MVDPAQIEDAHDTASSRTDHLMMVLRSADYSLPAAISDLIDNSTGGGARKIWPEFHWPGAESPASILDDGRGISETELADTMSIDSPSPGGGVGDLGRLGLGLNTAKFRR